MILEITNIKKDVEYLLKNKEFDYRLINCDKSTLDNFNKEFKKQYYKIYGTKNNN